MSVLRVRKRETGAVARLGRYGGVSLDSATGGHFDLVTAASRPGFNPVDLLYASLSACLAVSLRVAASEIGLFQRFHSAEVAVSGEKTEEEFARIGTITVKMTIRGDLSEAERNTIAERAEKICTISNTLHHPPRIAVSIG